jgi:urocanate hydratase
MVCTALYRATCVPRLDLTHRWLPLPKGDIFSLGFGPFRWVCTSGKESDLAMTDLIASQVTAACAEVAPEISKQQFDDNLLWINQADSHKMVVGSQARILYSNAEVCWLTTGLLM